MSDIGVVTARIMWDIGIPVPKGTVARLRGTTIGVQLQADDGCMLLKVPANQDLDTYFMEFQTFVPGLLPAVGNPAAIALVKGGTIDLGDVYPWATGAINGQLKTPPRLEPGILPFDQYTVYVIGTSTATIPNASGVFALPRVAAGQRRIIVSAGARVVGHVDLLVQPGVLTTCELQVSGTPHLPIQP